MMLQKMKNPKRASLLIAAAALTAGFMSTVLFAQTKGPASGSDAPLRDSTAVVLDMDVVAKNTTPKTGEISLFNNGTIAFKTVEKMPAFNGDLQGWLRNNMRYPDSIRAEKAKSGCMMQFTVAEDGKLGSPQLLRSSGDSGLDNEAMRVVSKMPKWLPGMQKGKPVPVIFTMAIFFKPNMGGC
jgi:TonB family protein